MLHPIGYDRSRLRSATSWVHRWVSGVLVRISGQTPRRRGSSPLLQYVLGAPISGIPIYSNEHCEFTITAVLRFLPTRGI